jgi:hypothetical protein
VEACSRWIIGSLCNFPVRRSLGVTLIQLFLLPDRNKLERLDPDFSEYSEICG